MALEVCILTSEHHAPGRLGSLLLVFDGKTGEWGTRCLGSGTVFVLDTFRDVFSLEW